MRPNLPSFRMSMRQMAMEWVGKNIPKLGKLGRIRHPKQWQVWKGQWAQGIEDEKTFLRAHFDRPAFERGATPDAQHVMDSLAGDTYAAQREELIDILSSEP